MLQRTGDPANLNSLRPHLELLANIDHNAGDPPQSTEQVNFVLLKLVYKWKCSRKNVFRLIFICLQSAVNIPCEHSRHMHMHLFVRCMKKSQSCNIHNFLLFVCVDAAPPTWEELESVMLAVKVVVHGLVEFIQNFSKKSHDTPQVRSHFHLARLRA